MHALILPQSRQLLATGCGTDPAGDGAVLQCVRFLTKTVLEPTLQNKSALLLLRHSVETISSLLLQIRFFNHNTDERPTIIRSERELTVIGFEQFRCESL